MLIRVLIAGLMLGIGFLAGIAADAPWRAERGVTQESIALPTSSVAPRPLANMTVAPGATGFVVTEHAEQRAATAPIASGRIAGNVVTASAEARDDLDSVGARIRTLQDSLGAARIAFNKPESMVYGQSTGIEVILAPEASGIDPGALLEDMRGTVQEHADIPFSGVMLAELTGADFRISPAGKERRIVIPGRHTRWSWSVTPTAFGDDKPLTVTLFAVAPHPDLRDSPLYLETFTEVFRVEVTAWDRLAASVSDLTAMHALLAGLAGSVAALGGFLLRHGRRLLRRRA